jgi:7-keto-8-aminopelargonate synthetase-like enzyme
MREPHLAAHCLSMGARLARRFEEAGLDTHGSASQIVSVFLHDESEACQLYARLRERKILTSVFVYPAVERGTGLVRFSVYSDVDEADIDYVAACTIEAVADLRPVRHAR